MTRRITRQPHDEPIVHDLYQSLRGKGWLRACPYAEPQWRCTTPTSGKEMGSVFHCGQNHCSLRKRRYLKERNTRTVRQRKRVKRAMIGRVRPLNGPHDALPCTRDVSAQRQSLCVSTRNSREKNGPDQNLYPEVHEFAPCRCEALTNVRLLPVRPTCSKLDRIRPNMAVSCITRVVYVHMVREQKRMSDKFQKPVRLHTPYPDWPQCNQSSRSSGSRS